jgi:hypothetical protein
MRTVVFAVLSTSTLVALVAIAAQSKWPRRSMRALVVARVDEPFAARQLRTSKAQLEDAIPRAATYERSIGCATDPAARSAAIAESRQLLRQLRRDWYWVLMTGFLVYLGGFGPAPWYWRIIAPIVVLVVSGVVYGRWVVKLPRTR